MDKGSSVSTIILLSGLKPKPITMDLVRSKVKESLRRSEIHSPTDFGDAMREYLDSPINQALESSNPVIKAFALVDRRTGRRAIDKMQLSEFEHSLVKAFYELRKSTVDHETVSK